MFDTLLARGELLAEVEAQRAVLRFLNGVDWLLRDPSQLVGRTPYDVVFQRGKVQLRRYHHRRSRPAAAPRPAGAVHPAADGASRSSST